LSLLWHLLLNSPAMSGWFARRHAARRLLFAGLCFRRLDNGANHPNYSHHNNDEDVHPAVVFRAPSGQN
jgi:hypothetical protein